MAKANAYVVGGRLALMRETRTQMVRGHYPTIVLDGDGACVDVGYRYEVATDHWIVVTGKRRTPDKAHQLLDYRVVDRRDSPRLMRKVPPRHDMAADGRDRDRQGNLRPLDRETAEIAGEQSSYTSSTMEAVPDSAEEPTKVDPEWGRRAAGRYRKGAKFAAEQRDMLVAERRTADLMREARRRNVDVSKEARLLDKLLAEGRDTSAPLRSIADKLGRRDMKDVERVERQAKRVA